MLFLRTSLRGAEFFYVYDGDGNIVRSIDISGKKEYNGSGIRTGKTVNGVKHTYTLDGTRILRDAWGVPEIKLDSSTCQIATITPFRYRGYYFNYLII